MPFTLGSETVNITVHRSTMSHGKIFEEIISFTEFSLDIKGEYFPIPDIAYRLEDVIPPLSLSLTGKIDKIDRVWKDEEGKEPA